MNIKEFQKLLESVNTNELFLTEHFQERAKLRGLHQFTDINQIQRILTTEVPKGIVDQDNDKFQIIYRHNDEYDAIVICALKHKNPLKISLVTCIKQEASRRVK